MADYQFLGIRPHIERACQGTLAVLGLVEKNKAVKDLNNLLCQAVEHQKRGKFTEAQASIEAAKRPYDELRVALTAAQEALDEVAGYCQPAMVDTPPEEVPPPPSPPGEPETPPETPLDGAHDPDLGPDGPIGTQTIPDRPDGPPSRRGRR